MARLPLVIALASFGLQFLYLAQSLIVVDHSKSFRRGLQSCHIEKIPVQQPWIRSGLWGRGNRDEMEESNTFVPPVEQSDQRNRQIQDRIQRRANRSGKNTRSSEDRSYYDSSTSGSRQSRRQQRQERVAKGSLIDDFGNEEQNYVNDVERKGSRQRRRRRRERLDQRPPSLFDSISSNPLVNDVIGYGSRAGRIAIKETGKLWDDLVDSTYSDSIMDEERRRSGFKWQQQSRRPMQRASRKRRRSESFSSTEEKRKRSSAAEESFSPSFYYSEKDEISSRKRDLQTQKEATRETRQRQQERNQTSRSFARTAAGDVLDVKPPSTSDMKSETQQGKLPIGQILDALDERNISYSPRASRKELEDLLLDVLGENDAVAVKNAEEDSIQVIEVESISPEEWQRQQEQKLLQKQKEQLREKEEKRKKQQQKQQQANAESKNQKVGTPKEPFQSRTTKAGTPSNFYRRSVNQSYRPSGFSSTATKAYGVGSSGARQRRRKQSQPKPREWTSSSSSSSSRSTTSVSSDSASFSKTKEETKRRIYSPYGERRSEQIREPTQSRKSSRVGRRTKEEFGDIRDDFDRFSDVVENDLGRFGDILANSVDNIFWGQEDEWATKPSKQVTETENYNDKEVDSSNRRHRKRKRHWKDRAEERLDKMMGVHKVGGKTYDRWSEQDGQEAEEEEALGYDAVSYIKGRKRLNRKRNNSRVDFWENEESIFSSLFGNNWDDSPQRSRRSGLDDAFGAFRTSRSLTALLRNMVVLAANFAISLSKWASVRDTIPRPVVLLGGVGAGFVSRPGGRIKNSLLVFLCFRVLGEWLSEPVRRTHSRMPAPRSSRRQERSRTSSDDKKKEEDGNNDRGDDKKPTTSSTSD